MPRVVLRPEIDDSAARARRTQDPDVTRAWLLDPDGGRAQAPPGGEQFELRE